MCRICVRRVTNRRHDRLQPAHEAVNDQNDDGLRNLTNTVGIYWLHL